MDYWIFSILYKQGLQLFMWGGVLLSAPESCSVRYKEGLPVEPEMWNTSHAAGVWPLFSQAHTYSKGRTSWKGQTNNNELVLLYFPLSQWYKYLPFKWGKQVLLGARSLPELPASC